ncbi:MAG TPA: type I phosphomannose isomerase catalytic subunit [Candidatus Saccharimonadales bacterium]|nr:type I phosphomannose isomerase catalytic subunit [Candidatus Saccharimonadales bacterium]
MTTLYPFLFQPILKERVWGGRNLERLYHKPLPEAVPIGESWEITDRPEGVSVISNGPLAGKDLHWLMENHRQELLGANAPESSRFPLLIKLLDAEDKLSVQVHPAPEAAGSLGGEPKTEMWYIAEAKPGAELYAGLRKGVTRSEFERCITEGTVAECIHRVPVNAGDVMFLPSGRVHAIGAGLVIFEIQQNSDTTYRVFDWNRKGLDGKPRDLHLKESLASINFEDYEPRLVGSIYSRNPTLAVRYLVDNPLFKVDACKVKRGGRFYLRSDGFQILAIVKGKLNIEYKEMNLKLEAGQFCLLPAALERVTVTTDTQVDFLQVQTGSLP